MKYFGILFYNYVTKKTLDKDRYYYLNYIIYYHEIKNVSIKDLEIHKVFQSQRENQ